MWRLHRRRGDDYLQTIGAHDRGDDYCVTDPPALQIRLQARFDLGDPHIRLPELFLQLPLKHFECFAGSFQFRLELIQFRLLRKDRSSANFNRCASSADNRLPMLVS